MLKIYGADLSFPANKVRMAAHVFNPRHEYIKINIREGENRADAYLKLHPAGKVPVIDDDGFVLFESDAIIKYFAAKELTPTPLYPVDFRQRALIDQWMGFATIHVGGAIAKVLFNRVFASFVGVPVDDRSLNDGLKFLDRFLPLVDNQLGRSGRFVGKQFSLADISLWATLDPAEVADINLTSYPHIVKWRGEPMRKDFYTKCHESYSDVLKQMMSGAQN
jgi:glutathione S-transferase